MEEKKPMLRSFSVENFRTFRRLELSGLGQVNLITGKNNVGKTNLLEALRLYMARGNPGECWRILEEHDEYQQGSFDPNGELEEPLDPEALFHGRRLEAGHTPTVRIGQDDNHQTTLTMSYEKVKVFSNEEGRVRIRKTDEISKNQEGWGDIEPDLSGIFIRFGEKRPAWIIRFRNPRSLKFGWRSYGDSSWSDLSGPPIVSAREIPVHISAQWWDAVSLTDAEERVIDCLRDLVPIQRFALVQHPTDTSERYFKVKLRDKDTPIPLRSLGEGVVRMFMFALAMENARDSGMLLIDEFENGIHYTALPDLWRFIYKAARMNGVQVFATTHSWDCVEAFQQATADTGEGDGALIKLRRKEEEILAVTLSADELAVATRDKIEVR